MTVQSSQCILDVEWAEDRTVGEEDGKVCKAFGVVDVLEVVCTGLV